MKISITIAKLLIISALLIISNENLALSKPENRAIFVQEYHQWLSGTFDQAVHIAGYVVSSEWLPDTDSLENQSVSE